MRQESVLAYLEMTALHQFLAEQLKGHGLRANFAKEIGVSPTSVKRWISGQGNFKFETLINIAAHFKLDPIAVFRMAGRPEYERHFRTVADYLGVGIRAAPSANSNTVPRRKQ